MKWIPLSLVFLCGCATWDKSRFTPDSFNYTVAVNHSNFSIDQHWFGLSWNLKEK